MPDLKYIPLSNIRVNSIALRGVALDSEAFLGLVSSIRSKGVLNPINVRRQPGDDGKEYVLVDGRQRFTASTEVGTGVANTFIDETQPDGTVKKVGVIPAQIFDDSDGQSGVLATQIIANVHKVETKHSEYATGIRSYLELNPTQTVADVAVALGKSPAWLEKILTLTNLHSDIKPLVDSGSITLAKALVLVKLPEEEQKAWLERAQTQPLEIFSSAALARAKEIRDAARKGREATPYVFQPSRHLKKKTDIEAEIDRPSIAPNLIRTVGIVDDLPVSHHGLAKAAERGFKLGLEWSLHVDPIGAKEQHEKEAKRVAAEKESAERKKADREAKKAIEAAGRQAEIVTAGASAI